MTWRYDVTALAASKKDQVRLELGDIYQNNQQLQDEEILFALSQRATIEGACAMCCRMMATAMSRSMDQSAGTAKASYSQLSKAYAQRALWYDTMAAMKGAGLPYAGGISITDKMRQQMDEDRVDPQFQIGMEDNFIPVAEEGNEALEGNINTDGISSS